MPSKRDQSASPSQKILSLFSLLLFTGRKYSLTRLAEMFNCSKQTVMRMTDELNLSRDFNLKSWLEGGQKWYQVEPLRIRPNVSLDPREIRLLVMCKELVWHLLPQGLRDEVDQAVNKTTVLLPDMTERASALDSICEVSVKGFIDYTPFQNVIEMLFKAIRNKNICKITYHSPHWPEPKSYNLAPIKILSYRESLYVEGFKVNEHIPPQIERETTFSIHRVLDLVILNKTFNFENILTKNLQKSCLFGFMSSEPFTVKVKFQPQSSRFVSERTWSEKQKISKHKDGSITLEFTAQSEQEVISWVLSFGRQATLILPMKLRKMLNSELLAMNIAYSSQHAINKSAKPQ